MPAVPRSRALAAGRTGSRPLGIGSDHPARLTELYTFDGNTRPQRQPWPLPHAQSLAKTASQAKLARKVRQNRFSPLAKNSGETSPRKLDF